MKKTFIFFLVLCQMCSLSAQKVLGKPDVFVKPFDYSADPGKAKEFITSGTKKKSKVEAWLVVSDRNNNPVYEKPGGSQISTVAFRDCFYVIEEDGDYVKVVEASGVGCMSRSVNIHRFVGWMRKENLILWNTSLVDPLTSITRKVFLVNRMDDISDMTTKINIYTNPKNNQKLEPLTSGNFKNRY